MSAQDHALPGACARFKDARFGFARPGGAAAGRDQVFERIDLIIDAQADLSHLRWLVLAPSSGRKTLIGLVGAEGLEPPTYAV